MKPASPAADDLAVGDPDPVDVRADASPRPPRRRRRAARAGEIVAAGSEHFVEHGYANTRPVDMPRWMDAHVALPMEGLRVR